MQVEALAAVVLQQFKPWTDTSKTHIAQSRLDISVAEYSAGGSRELGLASQSDIQPLSMKAIEEKVRPYYFPSSCNYESWSRTIICFASNDNDPQVAGLMYCKFHCHLSGGGTGRR